MTWLFVLILGITDGRAAPAAGRPYESLDVPADFLLGPVMTRRLFRGGEPRTLRALRDRYALALIYETHPFASQVARRLRQRVRDCAVPDAIAVLTADELEFAEVLRESPLNLRAKNFLALHRPRTLVGLASLDLDSLDAEDPYSNDARWQLRTILARCRGALERAHQPST